LRVALLVESSHAFGRQVLRGIAAYAAAQGLWTFHHEERAFDDPMPDGLKNWRPDGVIARVATPLLAKQLRRLGVPVIDVYEQGLLRDCARVTDNHRAVMRLAVEHLRGCGFQHFGYIGFPDAAFSRDRASAFVHCVTTWGFTPHVFKDGSTGKPRRLAAIEVSARRQAGRLATWLQALPKPVGVVACNDMRAEQVLAVCASEGIEVPDAMGVIGVDNDEVRCELASPPLSSVDPNAYGVGYEAAALLHRMVRGRRHPAQSVVVEPAGVVARRSTDTLAFSTSAISDVVRFIREHACEGLRVPAVVQHAKLSRTTLDRQLITNLGHTVRTEITRVQVQRIRELLATTDLSLKQITRRTGFSHMETMCRVVQRVIGQSPTEYRRTILKKKDVHDDR
jgi:LacI family transcriptional regulator